MGRLPVIWQTLDMSVNPLGILPRVAGSGVAGRGERPAKIAARRSPIKLAGALLALAAGSAGAVTLDEARALHQAGELAQAVEAYRAVAESGADAETAGTARNNACVVLMDLGDYHGALAECLEARRLREPAPDRRGFGRTLNNLGLVFDRLGRHAEAEAAYREALAINRARDDAEAQAINLRNLALLATQEGRFTAAREQLAEVLRLVARNADAPWAADQRRLALLNLGVTLEQLGAYEDALAQYRELIPEMDALEPAHRAALQINIGVVYRNLGDPVRALAAFREGVAAYESLGDVASLSNAWVNIGLVHHLNLDDPRAAESDYRQALALALQSGDRDEEAWDRVYLGRALLDQGRVDEAEVALVEALAFATGIESPEGRWTALEALARIDAARGDDRAALSRLMDAIAVIEDIRRQAGDAEMRAHFFADKRDVYGAAVEVLTRLADGAADTDYAERALGLVQRAKARELIEALGPTAQPAAPLESAELMASAGSDLILEYFIAKGRLYRFTIRRDGLTLRDLGSVAPVREAVEALHAELAAGRAPGQSELAQLSASLLAGVDLDGADALYVAPDDVLQYLPFELLTLSGEGEGPLIARTTVGYLPSASALAWLRASRVPADIALLAFGDVPARSTDDPLDPAETQLESFRLLPLMQSQRELDAARTWVPGTQEVLTGRSASEAAYRARAGRSALVVHFAAHALVDERPGRLPAVVLAPGEHADGLLRPDEIVDGRHPAALTVLAACRSAAGALEGGRALATLTGALLAAGSQAVVATLWDVDDTTTAAFMEQFYYEVGRGAGAAEALRRVKQRLSAEEPWRNPALWAGYVVIGDGSAPLVARGTPPLTGIGLAAAAMAALAWLLVTRRARA
jgi:CHAT domain-containing protein/Tfp pilus assembly protein PilF